MCARLERCRIKEWSSRGCSCTDNVRCAHGSFDLGIGCRCRYEPFDGEIWELGAEVSEECLEAGVGAAVDDCAVSDGGVCLCEETSVLFDLEACAEESNLCWGSRAEKLGC